MPSTLIHGDDDADEGDAVIQYRNPESRVVAEPAGMDDVRLVFTTTEKFGAAYQKPYPVVDDDADDPPDDAVLRSVAERLVETSPVFHFGAACPVEDCDDVFETEGGLASHYGKVHGGTTTDDAGDGDVPELEDADDGGDA